MKIVSGLRLSGALSTVAEALAAAGQNDAPSPGRPRLRAGWKQDQPEPLHCIWAALTGSAKPGLSPAAADRAAHLHAMGVLR